MKQKFNNPTNRVIVSIILGIIVGVFVCFMAIRLGYSHVKGTSLSEYSVNVFGFSIFDIRKVGGEFKGTPNNSNMMFIGLIFSMVLAIVTEVILAIVNKRRKEKTE
ncbi:LlsX family protein [Candidatus Enterococcus ikei]|uniref:LlsX family protein n=1 Tax=Candidatus Enterococcus ikei TaxID=2815326 RepID=A0ABS3GWI7_9ENTE|nr:LlsX family protein [Enterococcus sp. DIV0869a]MBO0439635.1 LlsX family protein [Enterococcus sp. DIV0869a]